MFTKTDLIIRYEQLQVANNLLLKDLKHCSNEELNYKSKANEWCILQVLNHIKNAEIGTLKYIEKKMKYGGLQKVSWSAGLRAFLMRSVNNSNLKIKMPKVLKEPIVDGSLESIGNDWKELHSAWTALIHNFPEKDLDKAIFRHPIFGRLSFLQTIDSMISHQNHHKKQLIRIKKKIALNKENGVLNLNQ